MKVNTKNLNIRAIQYFSLNLKQLLLQIKLLGTFFFGLVDSNNSNQSLRYSYNVKCEELDGDCSYDFDAIEQEVKDIMKSVKFKDVELEEGEN